MLAGLTQFQMSQISALQALCLRPQRQCLQSFPYKIEFFKFIKENLITKQFSNNINFPIVKNSMIRIIYFFTDPKQNLIADSTIYLNQFKKMSSESQNSIFKRSNQKSKSSYSRSPLHKITKIKSQANFPANNIAEHHVFDQNKFQNKLAQSIKQASQAFESVIIDYPHPVKDPLIELEYLLQIKKDQVQVLNCQLMQLKNVNDSIHKKKHKMVLAYPQDGLVKDIDQKKQQLLAIKEQYNAKMYEYQTKKKAMKSRQQQLLELSLAKDNKCLSYQQFLQFKRKKNGKIEKFKQQQTFSIKQPTQKSIQPQQYSVIQQKLLDKKEILENALENNKKKFLKEAEQLTQQIEFLREQNNILQSRIDAKQQQKREFESKFPSRNNASISKNKLTSLKNYD